MLTRLSSAVRTIAPRPPRILPSTTAHSALPLSSSHTSPSSSASSSFATAATRTARPPSRATVLSTYRQLRRAIRQHFYTASQYATFDELNHDPLGIVGQTPSSEYRKQAYAKEENKPHVAFVQKRSPRWLEQLAETYRANRTKTDPVELQRAQLDAEQLLTLMISNMEHSRYLLEGGWGLRRNQKQQLANVAHKVGLQMPKETAPLEWVPAGAKHQKARDEILKKHDKFVK